MIRQMIKIDEEKCDGCGLCVKACHEGAIEMIEGKAKLVRDDYCDGLGNCLPVCPTGAITFEEREAVPFDEEATKAKKVEDINKQLTKQHGGCPGSRAMSFDSKPNEEEVKSQSVGSQLRQWPVQIKLVPTNASYLNGAHLLIAADCTAYAYGDFHHKFMKNKITLIGCPKLDTGDYAEKLTAILTQNDIKSVTVVRMEVPCCGGIVQSTIEAIKNCGKYFPWQVVTITTDGKIVEE